MVDDGHSIGTDAGDPKRRGREVKITPLDIRRKEFKRSMRGYADEEVDVFLDEVADEFERLYQENGEMSERLAGLEEQIAGYMALKETLEKTLVSAQMQSDETRANARKEAELILRDASLKSRQIVNDSYGETQRVQQALVQLKHLEEDFRFKFRSLLEAHLKLVEQAPIAVVAPEAPRVAPPAVLFTEEDAVGAVAEVADSPRPEAKAEVPVLPEPAPIPDLAAQLEAVALEITEKEVITEETPAPELPAEPQPDGAQPALATEPVDEGGDQPATGQAQADEPPLGGFVFGQSLADGGDDFFVLGREKKGQDRDFEW